MTYHKPRAEDMFLTRRQVLNRCGMGFGALALADLMEQAGLFAYTPEGGSLNLLAPKKPHFPARAKRVIHLFANGGPSHVDTFDPKPLLDKYHGKMLPSSLRTEVKTGGAFRSPF